MIYVITAQYRAQESARWWLRRLGAIIYVSGRFRFSIWYISFPHDIYRAFAYFDNDSRWFTAIRQYSRRAVSSPIIYISAVRLFTAGDDGKCLSTFSYISLIRPDGITAYDMTRRCFTQARAGRRYTLVFMSLPVTKIKMRQSSKAYEKWRTYHSRLGEATYNEFSCWHRIERRKAGCEDALFPLHYASPVHHYRDREIGRHLYRHIETASRWWQWCFYFLSGRFRHTVKIYGKARDILHFRRWCHAYGELLPPRASLRRVMRAYHLLQGLLIIYRI